MLRMLFMAFVAFIGYHLLKGFGVFKKVNKEVRGKQKNKPLDFGDSDVEDAHFKDINDGES